MYGWAAFGFIPSLGFKELILILVIVLVIFGPKKLPEIGRSIGQMLSGFKAGTKETEGEGTETKPNDSGEDNKPGQS